MGGTAKKKGLCTLKMLPRGDKGRSIVRSGGNTDMNILAAARCD